MKIGAQLTFSSHFLFRPGPQSMGWCWYWVYVPQLNLSGNSTLEIHQEVCILGDSKSRPLGRGDWLSHRVRAQSDDAYTKHVRVSWRE